jgi:hypothetical protein
MHILLLITLLLSGCTTSPNSAEESLNQYALAAANGYEFDELLVGQALESALETRELIAALGLESFGASRFSQTKSLGENWFSSCLDVSATSFRDANGEQLLLDRLERQLVLAKFEKGRVADLQLEGVSC